MFRIGEFSKMSKTTIKTLRFYDEIDLLKPECTDDLSGYRFYSTDQLIRLHKIQSLRQIGLSLEDIASALTGNQPDDILKNRAAELLEEITEKKDQLSRLEFILTHQEEDYFMNYQATIKEIPGHIVYSKKMLVADYDAYFEVIPAIGEQVMTKYPDLKCANPEYCFIIYLANEYKEKDINIEFCEAVTELKEDFDDIHFKKIEPITAVSVMHKGPYYKKDGSGIAQAYAYAFKWIDENGYRQVDSPRENYIDGIWNKEDEHDWLTELQIPVEKK